MEVHHSVFPSMKFALPPYTFLPYERTHSPKEGWTDLPPDYDALQMHLRFPTPPITPPKAPQSAYEPHQRLSSQQRTQSVIMKVGQGQLSIKEFKAPEILGMIAEPKVAMAHKAANISGSTSPFNEYVCEWMDCGRYFESLESLASHVTEIHAVASLHDGLYYCRWAGCLRTDRGFNARYKMLVHVRTHTKEKPHQCDICEKSFSRAENLKIHIRSHSGEKPYVCTYEGCHKAYSNSSDRFKHTRTHAMEKPYMCKVPGCQKRYTDPSSLRKHVKTFKHAEQLLESVSPATPYTNSADKGGTVLEPTIGTSSYLGTPPAGHYYMAITQEDICHFKTSQLERYYAEESARSRDYWISDAPPHHSKLTAFQTSYQLEQDNFSMDIDLEMPLDLRVNRS